jgi:hypothetical protein
MSGAARQSRNVHAAHSKASAKRARGGYAPIAIEFLHEGDCTGLAASECRKPKADPVVKGNPGNPQARRLAQSARFVTTCRPIWLIAPGCSGLVVPGSLRRGGLIWENASIHVIESRPYPPPILANDRATNAQSCVRVTDTTRTSRTAERDLSARRLQVNDLAMALGRLDDGCPRAFLAGRSWTLLLPCHSCRIWRALRR